MLTADWFVTTIFVILSLFDGGRNTRAARDPEDTPRSWLPACHVSSRVSRDTCISPPPLLFADIEHRSQAMLIVDVNFFFSFLFRFQGKPTEHDKLQRKKKKRHVNGKELNQVLKTNDALFVDFLNRCLEWVWRIGSSLFRKLESSPIHRRNKIPYILCARHKVSSWQTMQNPIGERLLQIKQLTQHKWSTRGVWGEVNKWYRGSLSRSWWERNWPQSSAVNCSSDLH